MAGLCSGQVSLAMNCDGGDAAKTKTKTKTDGFIMLRYAIPAHLADPAPSLATPKGMIPHRHLELLRWQVNRVRDGLALATATNRSLILPALLCTCDRWFNLLPNCTQGDMCTVR